MPKLPTLLSNLDGLPEGLSTYYEPVDANDDSAGFKLLTDEANEKTKLSQFRDHNIELRKQVEGLDKRIGKLDGAEGRLAGLDKLLAKAKTDEDAESIKAGDIDGLVSRRVSEVVTSHESKFAALENVHRELTSERDGLRTRVGRGAVRDSLMSALDASKVRIKPGAVDDVLRRTHETWSMQRGNDGKEHLVAAKAGETVYGEDGKPQTMTEYVGKLGTEAPYFFESSGGAGSPGTRGPRVVDTRGKRGVDFGNPLEIGRNLDDLLAKKAVLINTPE